MEEQIQQVLSYVQGVSVNIQKKNMIENLKNKSLEFPIVGNFLINLRQKFRNRDNKLVNVVELKKMEQEIKIMQEFVQKFRRAATI